MIRGPLRRVLSSASSLDPHEVSKFGALSQSWWSDEGVVNPLREMNPARVKYVMDTLRRDGKLPPQPDDGSVIYQPLSSSGLRCADIGSGGGILIESLVRLGLPSQSLVSVEPSADLMAASKSRLEGQGLQLPGTMYNGTLEDFVSGGPAQVDLLTCLEVYEHIPSSGRPALLSAAMDLLKPGGLLVMSTLDRTLFTGLRAVVGAEYIAKVTPIGTHDYNKFIRPTELCGDIQKAHGSVKILGCATMSVEGGTLNEVRNYALSGGGATWKCGSDEGVDSIIAQPNETFNQTLQRISNVPDWGNYIIAFKKL